MFFTLIAPGRSAGTLLLERVAVSDGTRTVLARGEQPAISSDARMLAYTAGDEIAVRDLATGKTRTVDVSRYLGRRRDLLGAAVTWVGDRPQVAVVPAPVAIASTLRAPPRRGGAPVRAAGGSARPIVIIVRAGRGRLRAREFSLPGVPQAPLTAAGRSAHRGSFLLAFDARGDCARVYEITPPRAWRRCAASSRSAPPS